MQPRINPHDEGARYRVVRPLGRGAMGSVDLVYDTSYGREVARKRIQRVGPASLLRFKREFRALERLLHPNLVRLYELGEDECGPYFTMEAVLGADLRALSVEAWPADRLAGLIRQMALALCFLEAHG